MDKTAVKIVELKDSPSDFAFWQTQPFESRLKALEEIRQEYIGWRYDNRQEFQRVYTGIKIDFIDLENLKKNKKASGRHQDLADLDNLD